MIAHEFGYSLEEIGRMSWEQIMFLLEGLKVYAERKSKVAKKA